MTSASEDLIRSLVRSPWLVASLLATLVAGCAVGPDYNRPPPPEVKSYTGDPITSAAKVTGSEAQRLLEGEDIPGDWWELFHCKALDTLVERALKANPNLKAAQAALVAARETCRAQKGAYYPSVSGSFTALRQKTAGELSPTPNSGALYYNLSTPQVSVSYTPDVFGLNRRTVESLNAQAGQIRFALAATHITLSANVVAAAIQEASLRAQIAATQELIALNTNLLGVLRNQFAKGYVGRLEVAAQESQMAQTLATLPPLLSQLAQQRDLLAVLAGGFPSAEPAEKFSLSSLKLPRDLPLSLPSQLVAQRPDVRQAEENLHAACAQVGMAVANRLPNFLLSADIGSMALQAGQLFSSGTGFWGLAGGVTQPLFEGGALRHRERAARAAYLEAAEQYRGAVLTAFQNVADTLVALEQDGEALKAATQAEDAAKTTRDLTRQQWQSGYANYLAVLYAEQTYQQARLNVIQAEAIRYADTAALFLALGGGWWNRFDLPRE